MTLGEFIKLVGGFDMDSELMMSGKQSICMIENAVPIEKMAIDIDKETGHAIIVVG